MQVSENIQFYRKQAGFTQEAFAEKMGVSRQTVSKWESGGCYPEMEKLLLMCEMFECDLDTLVRGDAASAFMEDNIGYDKHMNEFTKQICTGTVLVLLGVCCMFALYGIGVMEEIAFSVLLCFVVGATSFFIIGGIRHSNFVKKHPQAPSFYKEEQVEVFNQKFPVLLVVGIAIVILAIIFLMSMAAVFGETRLDRDEQLAGFITAGFLLFIAVAAPIFIYAGMQKSKYDIDQYNHDNQLEKTKHQRVTGAICSCIMIAATAIFLVAGLVFDRWEINWIVFVIGGLLCAIVSTIGNSSERR